LKTQEMDSLRHFDPITQGLPEPHYSSKVDLLQKKQQQKNNNNNNKKKNILPILKTVETMRHF